MSEKAKLSSSLARYIGASVWKNGGDIRDVISVWKLVRKSDGPEQIGLVRGYSFPPKLDVYDPNSHLRRIRKSDGPEAIETLVKTVAKYTDVNRTWTTPLSGH